MWSGLYGVEWSSWKSSLLDSISTWISSLRDSISTWKTSLKNSIFEYSYSLVLIVSGHVWSCLGPTVQLVLSGLGFLRSQPLQFAHALTHCRYTHSVVWLSHCRYTQASTHILPLTHFHFSIKFIIWLCWFTLIQISPHYKLQITLTPHSHVR